MMWLEREKQKIDLTVDGGVEGLDRFSLHSLPVFACQSVIILTSSNRLDIAYEKTILLAQLHVVVLHLAEKVHVWNLRRSFHKRLVHVCRKCTVGEVKKLISILYRQVQLEYCTKEGEKGVGPRERRHEKWCCYAHVIMTKYVSSL